MFRLLLTNFFVFFIGLNSILYSQYCASGATSSFDSECDRVILNGSSINLDNNTTGICAQYSNFTGLAAPDLMIGSPYTVSITQGTCGGNYTRYVNAWIDWNQDNDFADAGEMLGAGTVGSSSAGLVTNLAFNVPGTAVPGTTRMRVIVTETGPANNPCASYAWGETEDYSVTIISSGPMAYNSSNTVQASTANVGSCETAATILKIEIETDGGIVSPLSATQLNLTTAGTTNLAEVSQINVYYTGSTNVFSTGNLFGSATAGASVAVNGSQTLSFGTNYFWVEYILNSPTIGNTLDGTCTGMVVSGSPYAPSTSSPAGSRTIGVCNPSPGGVANGLETWVRADNGVTGTSPVTAWSNQNAAGTEVLVHGAPVLNNSSTSYNYNPFVEFAAPAGTLDNGWAANRQFLHLNGYSDINGISYTGLFFAFHLNDLSRVYTHIATVENVTFSTPANGTFHGDASGAVASILLESYDISDFGTSAPGGTWRRNGLNIASNSVHTSEKQVLSASCFTGGSTTLNTFLGGQRDQIPASSFAGHVRDWKGPCAEIIGYTQVMTTTERQKIDSYLAIKYGMTLTFNYLNTAATTIYTVSAPYIYNIIGIGRDDAEALVQKQSHQDDDSVRIYLNTLSAMNSANTGVFNLDRSYVLMGSDDGQLCATMASIAEMPIGLTNCLLYSRLEREWKVQRSNMAQVYNMDVKLADCGAPGSVVVSDLRFLVDDDGDFANGGTQCYYNGDGTGIALSYSGSTITVSGISTTHIPDNSIKYVTIASIDVITPLPAEMLSFDAKLNGAKDVDLTWITTKEINTDYFILERSQDGQTWEFLGTKDAAGNSDVELTYEDIDRNPYLGITYYKLTVVDNDGAKQVAPLRSVNLKASSEYNLAPNPAKEYFILEGKDLAELDIKIIDGLGKVVKLPYVQSSENMMRFDSSPLSAGVYFIWINSSDRTETLKLVIE